MWAYHLRNALRARSVGGGVGEGRRIRGGEGRGRRPRRKFSADRISRHGDLHDALLSCPERILSSSFRLRERENLYSLPSSFSLFVSRSSSSSFLPSSFARGRTASYLSFPSSGVSSSSSSYDSHMSRYFSSFSSLSSVRYFFHSKRHSPLSSFSSLLVAPSFSPTSPQSSPLQHTHSSPFVSSSSSFFSSPSLPLSSFSSCSRSSFSSSSSSLSLSSSSFFCRLHSHLSVVSTSSSLVGLSSLSAADTPSSRACSAVYRETPSKSSYSSSSPFSPCMAEESRGREDGRKEKEEENTEKKKKREEKKEMKPERITLFSPLWYFTVGAAAILLLPSLSSSSSSSSTSFFLLPFLKTRLIRCEEKQTSHLPSLSSFSPSSPSPPFHPPSSSPSPPSPPFHPPSSSPSPRSPPFHPPSSSPSPPSHPPSSSPPSSTSSSPSFPLAGEYREDLPSYTSSDLRGHGAANPREGRLWVAYRRGVYDVTDFVNIHPGGRDRLLLAVGKELDGFWRVYGQHNLSSVHELLEIMRIGNYEREEEEKEVVEIGEGGKIVKKIKKGGDAMEKDTYAFEPERHPALIVRSEKPFNAETPLSLLTDSFYTPNDLFFVRNHLPVPKVDVETYKLEVFVESPDGKTLRKVGEFSLEDLQKKFYSHHLPCAVQCAGNRRDDFNQRTQKRVKGLEWRGGAIGNALWTGCLLADVLRSCGMDEEKSRHLGIKHVHFEGHDSDPLTKTNYAASIPIQRAILGSTLRGESNPDSLSYYNEKEESSKLYPFYSTTSYGSKDVLLAYEMNGRPLPIDHGFPLRALVPGAVGARSVKWLKRIVLSSRESPSHWQQQDYKILSPSDTSSTAQDLQRKASILDLPVQSAICVPTSDTVLPPGTSEVDLKGYAWCGGGRPIVRVDVSLDGGKTWTEADLQWHHQPSSSDEEEEEEEKEEEKMSTEELEDSAAGVRSPETGKREEGEETEKKVETGEGVEEDEERDPDKAWSWVLWSASIPIPEEYLVSPRGHSSSAAQPGGEESDGENKTSASSSSSSASACHTPFKMSGDGLDQGRTKKKGDLIPIEIICRAVDASSNSQPEGCEPLWNVRGCLNNSWHRITVYVHPRTDSHSTASSSSSSSSSSPPHPSERD
ncbi:sulfite oxidase [Cystoisospora suis]|uniref:Sulfite oxidase n=1 Tax=Cystoisospora suis TaxID=483139 RepID=A0A2C6L9S6_9APIC|nr:sulfite oxidase [Cystoisospora suis]